MVKMVVHKCLTDITQTCLPSFTDFILTILISRYQHGQFKTPIKGSLMLRNLQKLFVSAGVETPKLKGPAKRKGNKSKITAPSAGKPVVTFNISCNVYLSRSFHF